MTKELPYLGGGVGIRLADGLSRMASASFCKSGREDKSESRERGVSGIEVSKREGSEDVRGSRGERNLGLGVVLITYRNNSIRGSADFLGCAVYV